MSRQYSPLQIQNSHLHQSHSTQQASSSKTLLWGEGLRGCAAFLVVIFHLFWVFIEHAHKEDVMGTVGRNGTDVYFWQLPILRFFIAGGAAQVGIFFVLSGVVLSYKLLCYIRDGNVDQVAKSVQSACFRRFFRLAVPATCANVVTFLLIVCGLQSHNRPPYPPPSLPDSFLSKLYVLVRESIRTFTVGSNGFDEIQWTMRPELYGSILVFMYCFLASRLQLKDRGLIAFILAIYFLFAQIWYLTPFFLAILISECIVNGQKKYWHRWLSFVLFPLGLYIGSYPEYQHENTTWSNQLHIIGSWLGFPDSQHHHWGYMSGLAIVSAVALNQTLQSFFCTRPMLYLGRISFSMYLFHGPMLKSIAAYLFWIFNEQLNFNNNITALAMTLIIFMPLLFFVSEIGTRTMDRWGVEVGRKVDGYLNRPVENKEII